MEYTINVQHREPVFTPFRSSSGFALPSVFEVEADDTALPYIVTMAVRVEGGMPVCDAVSFRRRPGSEEKMGGPPVTSERLRTIPLGALLRQGAARAALRVEDLGSGGFKLVPVTPGDEDAFYAEWRQTGRRTRRPVSEEDLKRTAEVYRAALSRGDDPTATVASVLNISRSSAGRWVMKTRRAGLLPKTTARQARA